MTVQPATLRDLELELARRKHEDPLGLVYKPHDKQQAVHRSRSDITLVLGGNRGGKSWSAVAESQYYAAGRATWAEVPDPPVQVWYVMPSLPMYRRSILPIFNKIAPMREIKRVYQRDGIVAYKNGSELHFLSADMRQRRLQGASIHLGIMDETPDENVFDELLARVLDTGGRLLMVFSPIDQATYWVRDKLYNPWVLGERTDIDVINMAVADESGNSLVPWFDREDIKRMEQQWPDPVTRAARIYGQFVSREGLVFRSFSAETHTITPFKIPQEYARWLVIDPQYHRFAALYFAADEQGNYYITDEYFSQDETLAARAERLAAVVGKLERPIPAYVDSANPQDIAELNWHFARINASIAAVPLPMQKKVDDMVLRTHALLEPNDERAYPLATGVKRADCLFGAPRLLLFNDLVSRWRWGEKDMVCSRLIWELQRLSWAKTGKPDKSSADGGDCCDCLVYGCTIMQTGVPLVPVDAWRKNLSTHDAFIWGLIDQAEHIHRQWREG